MNKRHILTPAEVEEIRTQIAATQFVVTHDTKQIALIVTYGGDITYIVRAHGTEVARVASLDQAVAMYNDL